MLIPKNVKKLPIDNPFRPKTGIPTDKTKCRISWGEFEIEQDEFEYRLRVDADHIDDFVTELEATVPEKDRYRCANHEVWLIKKEYKKEIVELAKKYFDEVQTELRQW